MKATKFKSGKVMPSSFPQSGGFSINFPSNGTPTYSFMDLAACQQIFI